MSLVSAAGLSLAVSGLGFLVAETLTAAAWQAPPYDYVRYFISDLGSPQCGPFQGRDVCSPRHALVNTAFIAQGLLFAFGGSVLSRRLTGRAGPALLGLSLAQGLGVVLVGTFHSSPAAEADGTALLHGAGAALAIVGGNAASVVAGVAWRRAGRRRLAAASVLLGWLGLAGSATLVGTWSLVPPGILERAAVYPFQVWQVLAGVLLVRDRTNP